jgi:hypothetical protein
MKRFPTLALLGLALAAAPLAAQGPGPQRGPGAGALHGAEFLLAHTGELRLTDQQVVRLAAIARRTAERREGMRAQMESRRPPQPGQMPSAEDMQRMRQQMEQMRDQRRADLRDALAVLTPDQQAQAFELVVTRRGGHGPDNSRGMRGQQMRRPGGRGEGARPGRRGDMPPPPPSGEGQTRP